MSAPKPSYVEHVPAVDQASRILFALGRNPRGSATLTEICGEVGISKSKGLAILNTLRSAGLVAKSESSKMYRLGPRLLTLSRALLDHTDLAHEAAPYLDDLVAATGCTALLGLVSGDRLFVIARRENAGKAPVKSVPLAPAVGIAPLQTGSAALPGH